MFGRCGRHLIPKKAARLFTLPSEPGESLLHGVLHSLCAGGDVLKVARGFFSGSVEVDWRKDLHVNRAWQGKVRGGHTEGESPGHAENEGPDLGAEESRSPKKLGEPFVIFKDYEGFVSPSGDDGDKRNPFFEGQAYIALPAPKHDPISVSVRAEHVFISPGVNQYFVPGFKGLGGAVVSGSDAPDAGAYVMKYRKLHYEFVG